ncbi:Peptidoglycan-binding lysin domain-containing protein [Thalictrum thalictroides]|uniref:Peptidoglycan-binding lysin domain-containing protein n=1 Tax=Thalictrum thalictroides TaxID=46969 RepID=A0A7J6WGP3_THATH|nr:Peptidoglycan-binding lysin domain-containing protein [Thalictrum thalictroides]
MAIKMNNKAAMFLSIVLMLSLLLSISMADARLLGEDIKAKTPSCDAVLGVQTGDTCFEFAQYGNMTARAFSALNPNLNCNALFVGQWICVSGSLI